MLGLGPPQGCLKLGPRQATWVERSPGWRAQARRFRFCAVDLPQGLLKPSPVKPNISDPDDLQSRLRGLTGIRKDRPVSSRPIVLVLPDRCVRSTLLEVGALPTRSSERDALIRWRLEKEAGLPMTGARIVSRTVGPSTVLAVTIQEPVLQQYEEGCNALGLIPARIEITSFLLEQALHVQAPGEDPVGWLSLLDEGFTLLIRKAGHPVFLRAKMQTVDILGDLASSLAYFEESRRGSTLRRLHLLSEDPDWGPVLAKELDLDVVTMGWADLQQSWRVPVPDGMPIGVLPAVAGLAPPRKRGARPFNIGSDRHALLGRVCAGLALLSLLLVVLIVWDFREAHAIRTQAQEMEQALARVRDQDRRAQHQAKAEGLDLSDAVLERLAGDVTFANALIAKRAFSWTRFLGDLENAVPPHVSIHDIRLDFKSAVITISGSALSLKDMTMFIIGLEDHDSFRDANLSRHRVLDGDGTGVAFSLTVRYQPPSQRQ